MKTTFFRISTVSITLSILSACGGASISPPQDMTMDPPAGGGDTISFIDSANFTLAERTNPLDPLFAEVTTNFNILNGSPLSDTNSFSAGASYIGKIAFRENATDTLFSGTLALTFDFISDEVTGEARNLSIAHSATESIFIDGSLQVVVPVLEDGQYNGTITGTLTERVFSPRFGVSYAMDGTLQGAMVEAEIDFLDGTRTFGTIDGQITRNTGEVSDSDGLFYANY